MKILHMSDTHGYHNLLTIPEDIDMIIHSGDFSNYYDVYKNEPEALAFLNWYASLKTKYKILIAGNHDALAFKWGTKFKALCKDLGIIYLENDYIEIGSIKIWGSPYTPTFGDWYFMKQRFKLYDVWQHIPEDTDIIVVHGPPKGILDLSEDRNHNLERCGCSALRMRIHKIKPKAVLFGHIHNNEGIINAGVLKLSKYDTIFSNGSVVTDNKFGILTSTGNIIEL